MPDHLWIDLAAAVALAGLMAYAVLGGADFGGGVWDLLAAGPRRADQRRVIAKAMGPVWEANHVWLIFVLVVLFTCFPYGYAALATALFVPFHLALVGIMLRGAAFVFRGHEASDGGAAGRWGRVFGVASVISPFLLGATFGAITSGEVRVDAAGHVSATRPMPWLSGYAIGCGLLALSTCAYLAAVYLSAETDGDLREDFRRRAIWAGTATAGLAGAVLLLAYNEAPWFLAQLVAPRSWPVLAAGLGLFALSAWAVLRRRYRPARVFAAGEIVALLIGWGLAHRPYLIYPDVTLARAAGPVATIRVLMYCLPIGMAMLVPSLWLLFRVFKGTRHRVSA
jgi:cytochrome d ubiquinol oxidase subunit II